MGKKKKKMFQVEKKETLVICKQTKTPIMATH